MKKQKTIIVNNKKIKIVSRYCSGLCVRTIINDKKYFSNIEIMKGIEISVVGEKDFIKLFIQKAMDIAFCKWLDL